MGGDSGYVIAGYHVHLPLKPKTARTATQMQHCGSFLPPLLTHRCVTLDPGTVEVSSAKSCMSLWIFWQAAATQIPQACTEIKTSPFIITGRAPTDGL